VIKKKKKKKRLSWMARIARMHTLFWLVNLKGKNHLGDVNVDRSEVERNTV
jgi:hypothetical protein